jgi:glycosyltransferase involved in cell wall biosynthesis
MRLVLDLQACQTTGSRFRGIGRYSMALTKAMVSRAHAHEVWVALNGAFPDSIEAVRNDLRDLIPADRIRIWNVPGQVAAGDTSYLWQRKAAEVLRETFLHDLKPDLVHVSSLFEGLGDNAVTSVGHGVLSPPAAVTLFDLIPLINQSTYLSNPVVKDWYFDKVASLRRAKLLLAISESSRQEAIEHLGISAAQVVNISSATDPMFRPVHVPHDVEEALRVKLGLSRPFIMYTGGIDHRKNIEGLIRAFAMLPVGTRRAHQLAIVCKVQDEERVRLQGLAAKLGLGSDELVMSGFVSDDELVALCNLCQLFVFPSWHEGFGLPALEAMACGAPVIAANTSSLPEVIGRADALFDPHRDEAIAAAMQRALTDEDFRRDLARHGPERARLFSWDETARRALNAMEAEVGSRQIAKLPSATRSPGKPRLAFVSPLPPERSGIANYSAELLPALAEHYEIDLVNDQVAVGDPLRADRFPIRSVAWFEEHAASYERVIYHFGNSPFHSHMFGLLRRVPGVVVLHDFYLGHILRHLEATNELPQAWWSALYESHGYPALIERTTSNDSESLATKYPCSWRTLADADGVIVHSRFSVGLVEKWYGSHLAERVRQVPLMRQCGPLSIRRESARSRLKLPKDAFIVASFGIVSPAKLIHRLLDAWRMSCFAVEQDCLLVLAGEANDPQYTIELNARVPLVASAAAGCVIKTGFLEQAQYQDMLEAVDVAVQLRADTRGETSGAVLDCLAHGIPTIVNAHGPVTELPQDVLLVLPDAFSDQELVTALTALRGDASLRDRLSRAGRAYLEHELAPDRVAQLYRDAIETFVESSPRRRLDDLAKAIVEATVGVDATESQLIDVARIMAEVRPLGGLQRQFFVDVSELVRTDAKSGIQRVVRSVLSELLARSPDGVRVEPVYADGSGVYRYARQFAARFLDLPFVPQPDAVIEAAPGDTFLGLDLSAHIIPYMTDYFRSMRDNGVSIQFVLYDLLPALQPQWFPADLAGHLQRWYAAIGEVSERVIAISSSVANEYRDWLDGAQPERRQPLKIGYFHLGADIESSAPTRGIDAVTQLEIDAIAGRPAFLMVGTVEPRKGHAQALDAFDRLWASGSDAVLVIVGKRGWRIDDLANRLSEHTERGRRLYWFEDVSDDALESIYSRSALLLAASMGEGFGLPLIEAARRHLPLLVRDIPVFREVAGSGAIYFHADSARELAVSIEMALEGWRKGELPDPGMVEALTWKESSSQLLDAFRGQRDVSLWIPGERFYFPVNHPALRTQVGSSADGSLSTDGMAGYLLHSPELRLAKGRYALRIHGGARASSKAYVEAVSDHGGQIRLHARITDLAPVEDMICECLLNLDDDVENFILRLWVDEDARLSVRALEICVLARPENQALETEPAGGPSAAGAQ